VITHLIFVQHIFTDIILNKKEIIFIEFLFFEAIFADIEILFFSAFVSVLAFFNSLFANITSHRVFPFLVILTKLVTNAVLKQKQNKELSLIPGMVLKRTTNLSHPGRRLLFLANNSIFLAPGTNNSINS